ncbi:hypothetical protein Q7P35_006382 [Cladosporium inversicolor]
MAPPLKIAAGSKTATSKVFTNVDLMEDVLLRLPLREILFLNGVCKGLQKVYNDSPRIQKVLFLSPATEHKIYYPNCNRPFWYLAPDREDLLTAGFIPKDSDDDEDDITPTNSPRRRAQAKPANNKKEINFIDTSSGLTGERVIIFDGKSRNPINFTPAGRYQPADGGSSGMETEGSGASGENACRAMVLYNGSGNGNTDTQVKGKIDSTSDISTPEQRGKGKANLATDTPHARGKYRRQRTRIPRSLDGKMFVSRVTPPFINPFFEVFFERFFHGIRGIFYPKDAVPPYLIPDSSYVGDVAQHPKNRHWNGTTEARYSNGKPARHSKKTNAVLNYDASWRKMHPFSATTSSIEVECFDFGDFEVFCDWGLLCGSLMEQLGEHWSEKCKDCCIPDFWFAEFIKEVCYTDLSHFNRGNHGVRKLGSVHQIGWEILGLLNANPVTGSCFQDRIRPY